MNAFDSVFATKTNERISQVYSANKKLLNKKEQQEIMVKYYGEDGGVSQRSTI